MVVIECFFWLQNIAIGLDVGIGVCIVSSPHSHLLALDHILAQGSPHLVKVPRPIPRIAVAYQ